MEEDSVGPGVKVDEQSWKGQSDGDMAPRFSRGSYRKYMNQLIRGNSDTEISHERPFLGGRPRPRSAVFGRDQIRSVGVGVMLASSPLARDGSTDTLRSSQENMFSSASGKDVFRTARRMACSWRSCRQIASKCSSGSDMTASTETLVGDGDSCECRASACGMDGEPPARQRRTGAGTSRVEVLVQRYTELIQRHMESSRRSTVRSSLPNLDANRSSKVDSAGKDKLSRKLRKLSLTFGNDTGDMGGQSSPLTSPTYLALPSFRKSKRKSSNMSDEGCSVPPVESPVSSEDGEVSSDSAVGCEDDDAGAGCVSGSDSKTYLLDQVVSEERQDIELRSDRWFIEHYGSSVLGAWVTEGEVSLDRRMSEVDSVEGTEGGQERRESCLTDDDEPGYRYLRTPSVVVSDHSDDPALASSSITLEEIERFRKEYAERQNSIGDSSSDCSSWSNVCSTISALDAEFVLRTPERKASDCSSCSTLSGDEETCDQILQDVCTYKVPVFLHSQLF